MWSFGTVDKMKDNIFLTKKKNILAGINFRNEEIFKFFETSNLLVAILA